MWGKKVQETRWERRTMVVVHGKEEGVGHHTDSHIDLARRPFPPQEKARKPDVYDSSDLPSSQRPDFPVSIGGQELTNACQIGLDWIADRTECGRASRVTMLNKVHLVFIVIVTLAANIWHRMQYLQHCIIYLLYSTLNDGTSSLRSQRQCLTHPWNPFPIRQLPVKGCACTRHCTRTLNGGDYKPCVHIIQRSQHCTHSSPES